MDDLNTELKLVQAALRRLESDVGDYSDEVKSVHSDLDAISEKKLELLAAKLTQDIRENFWNSVKRGLLVAAVLASVATAGGLLTASDILKGRVEAAVEGKQTEIAKLREGIVAALVETKVRAELANREVDQLRSRVDVAIKEVVTLREKVAAEAAQAVSAIGVDVKSVSSRLERYQITLAETQRRLESTQAQADQAQTRLTSQFQVLETAVKATQAQSNAFEQQLTRLEMKTIQESLTKLNRYSSPSDGIAGPATRQAIRKFQEDFGLTPANGELSATTFEFIAREVARISKQ